MEPGRVVHLKREPYDVRIDRATQWGNPYSHQDNTVASFRVATREESIERYRHHLHARLTSGELALEDLAALAGKTLGCWCAPKACHGDVLARAAVWAHGQLHSS